MRKEKLILSIGTLFFGIIVAVIVFYVYETTHQIKPSQIQKITISTPTPVNSQIPLFLNEPKDQSVVTDRIITVSGKTDPNAKIVVLTQAREVGAVSAGDGSFTTQITLGNDENIIEVDAVSSNGQTARARRTVTYSTENF